MDKDQLRSQTKEELVEILSANIENWRLYDKIYGILVPTHNLPNFPARFLCSKLVPGTEWVSRVSVCQRNCFKNSWWLLLWLIKVAYYPNCRNNLLWNNVSGQSIGLLASSENPSFCFWLYAYIYVIINLICILLGLGYFGFDKKLAKDCSIYTNHVATYMYFKCYDKKIQYVVLVDTLHRLVKKILVTLEIESNARIRILPIIHSNE